MASPKAPQAALRLSKNFSQMSKSDPATQCFIPRLIRSMATVSGSSTNEGNVSSVEIPLRKSQHILSQRPLPRSSVMTTLHNWPSMEPIRLDRFGSHDLDLPLRRDILHRAVVYEGDMTRMGTANTKWRDDVHGSNRKLAPQKGLGRARVGDRKSPIRRGGGAAFGPKARDFSSGLNRKIYDLAWRTALSYRWRKGELLVVDNTISMPWDASPYLLQNIFDTNNWGKEFGRSTLVTMNPRPRLFDAMEKLGKHGMAMDIFDVDVKDLLMTGRIIIENHALRALLAAHRNDLGVSTTLEKAQSSQQRIYQRYLARKAEQQELGGETEYEATEEIEAIEEEEEIEELGEPSQHSGKVEDRR